MNENQKIGAVVLAAGLSQRMGQQKLILPWGKHTVIEQVLESLKLGGVELIVVVTGKSYETLLEKLAGSDVTLAFNPDYSNGSMMTSLQVGIAALSRLNATSAILALGDQPQILPDTVQVVLQASQLDSDKIIVPSWQMRRGHPWVIPARFWKQILSSHEEFTMRDFLNSNEDAIRYVLVDTPTILADLDTPEEYEQQRPSGLD